MPLPLINQGLSVFLQAHSALPPKLRRHRDWSVIVGELEKDAPNNWSDEDQSSDLMVAARLCELATVDPERAARLYQRAWQVFPQNRQALAGARSVCWTIGHADMVRKLAEVELEQHPESAQLAALVGELHLDFGQADRAASFLAKALGHRPTLDGVRDALATSQYDRSNWQGEVEDRLQQSRNVQGHQAAALALSAARILRCEEVTDGDYETALRQTLSIEPDHRHAGWCLEKLLGDQQRFYDLENHLEAAAESIQDADRRAKRYSAMAIKWLVPHKEPARSATFARYALQAHAEGDAPDLPLPVLWFGHTRTYLLEHREQTTGLFDLALKGTMHDEERVWLATFAGELAATQWDDRQQAAAYFEHVRRLEPGSDALNAFDGAKSATAMEKPEATPDKPQSAITERAIELCKQAIVAAPTIRAPRRELAKVLRDARRWPALIAAFKDEAAKACETDNERAEIMLEMVQVYRDEMKLDLLVLSTLREALEVLPGSLAAHEQLVERLESLKRWSELSSALTTRAKIETDPQQKRALYLRVATVNEEKCKNRGAMMSALENVLALEPGDTATATRLVGAYETRREYRKLIAVRRQLVSRVSDANDRLAQTVELAEFAAAKIRRPEDLIEVWRDVLLLSENHLGALTELEKLYERQKDWQALADVFGRRARQSPDDNDKIAALQRLATLCTEKLDDEAGAIDALRQVLTLDSGHHMARQAITNRLVAKKSWAELEDLYASQDKLLEFVRLMEREAAKATQGDQLELWRRIASVYGDRLGMSRRALRALEKILTIDENDLGAAEALIPLYKEDNAGRKLATVLHVRLAHTEDPDLLFERTCELAQLFTKRLRDDKIAFDWWEKALRLDFHLQIVRDRLEHLAERTGQAERLVALYQEATANADDNDSDALAMMLTVTRLYEQELGQSDKALETAQRILAVHTQNPDALDALERLYLARERYQDLLAIYDRQLDYVHEPAERAALLDKFAKIAEEHVGDDRRAITAYRALLELVDEDKRGEILSSLVRLYERTQSWEDLANALARWLALPGVGQSTTETRVAMQYKRAQLLENQLWNTAEAIKCYGAVLMDEPSHKDARHALEAHLANSEHQQVVASLLEPIYAQTGPPAKLVQVYRIQAQHTDDKSHRADLLERVATLYETQLGQVDAAFAAYGQLLGTSPSDKEAIANLERIADITGAWSELADAYRKTLSQPLELSEQIDLRCRLGILYKTRLDEPERARKTFSRVMDMAPGNPTALSVLEEIFEAAQQWTELANVLRKKRHAVAGEQGAVTSFRLAHLLATKLDDVAGAIEIHRETLCIDPVHKKTIKALENLFLAGGDHAEAAKEELDRLGREHNKWPELIADFRQRAITLEDTAPLKSADLWLRIAKLCRAHLPDERSAPAALRAALRIAPEYAPVLDAMAEMHRERKAWAELAAVLEQRAKVEDNTDNKATHLMARAQLIDTKLNDNQQAINAYRQVLDADPSSGPALVALERLYAASENTIELVAVLEQRLRAMEDQEERASTLAKMAAFYRKLETPNRAAECFEQLLDLDHTDGEAYRQLERAYYQAKNWEKLVDAYDRHATVERDVKAASALRRCMAKLFEDQLNDSKRAIDAYKKAISLDANDVQSTNSIGRLLSTAGDIDKAVTHHLSAARRFRKRHDDERAFEQFKKVAALHDEPEAQTAIAELETRYESNNKRLEEILLRVRKAQDWNAVVQVLERLAKVAKNPVRQGQHRYQAALVARDRLDDIEKTLDLFNQALDSYFSGPTLPSTNLPLKALQAIDALLTAKKDWRGLERNYKRMIERVPDDQGQILLNMLWQNLAELYQVRLDDQQAAQAAFAKAMQTSVETEDAAPIAVLDLLSSEIKDMPVP